MEQPMFYQGQRVVCITIRKQSLSRGSLNPLIEGKSYYVSDPDGYRTNGEIYIQLSGINPNYNFNQKGFIPYDTDCQLEEQIFEAMKGVKIENL